MIAMGRLGELTSGCFWAFLGCVIRVVCGFEGGGRVWKPSFGLTALGTWNTVDRNIAKYIRKRYALEQES